MPEPVGFVGLGAMGSRMARRLVAAGHPVIAWTRTPAPIPGVELVASPAAVAERCGTVLGCLLDDTAIERVYLADDGLLAAARPGRLFVEHGTFSARLALRLHERASAAGATFFDAPVTGGPEGAEQGTLVAMAGADAAAVAAASGIFGAYLASVTPLGGIGSGIRLKLVNQLLVSVHITVAVEAALLLRRSGIDLADALPVLGGGWAASAMLERELPLAMTGEYASSGATIGGLVPVLALVAGALDDLDLESELLPRVRALFARAEAAGLSGSDPAALATLYGGTA